MNNVIHFFQFFPFDKQTKQVMIFAKSYCPYCKSTKATFRKLLGELGLGDEISFKVLESNAGFTHAFLDLVV